MRRRIFFWYGHGTNILPFVMADYSQWPSLLDTSGSKRNMPRASLNPGLEADETRHVGNNTAHTLEGRKRRNFDRKQSSTAARWKPHVRRGSTVLYPALLQGPLPPAGLLGSMVAAHTEAGAAARRCQPSLPRNPQRWAWSLETGDHRYFPSRDYWSEHCRPRRMVAALAEDGDQGHEGSVMVVGRGTYRASMAKLVADVRSVRCLVDVGRSCAYVLPPYAYLAGVGL
ncbi:hypothetical protein GGS23DRAFT_87949 [Durotheca rogersii]|uniref:uncharacterized protein n=1 Tax=Durotheca rogersii TaxID=419775 RepID=UPI002220C651|nr:uncharacterized protein GGS23DRAFT_87949 [Durotheca rogersii]KAI5862686.1 hypothetical protein GGS23DRAFT_87949 [Durotheca rogersii]